MGGALPFVAKAMPCGRAGRGGSLYWTAQALLADTQ